MSLTRPQADRWLWYFREPSAPVFPAVVALLVLESSLISAKFSLLFVTLKLDDLLMEGVLGSSRESAQTSDEAASESLMQSVGLDCLRRSDVCFTVRKFEDLGSDSAMTGAEDGGLQEVGDDDVIRKSISSPVIKGL